MAPLSVPYVAFALLAGSLALHALPELPPPPSALLLVPLAAAAWRWRAHRPARLAVVVALGFAWSWLAAAQGLAARLPAGDAGETVAISGTVVGLPTRLADGSVRFVFDVRRGEAPRRLRARLVWPRCSERLLPGQRWTLQARLRPPRGYANPGGFDYEGWLFRQGIGATGYVQAGAANRLIDDGAWRAPVDRLRAALSARLAQLVGDRPARGVILTLAVGDRQYVAREQWATLRATGLSHLMAISGLHIGMIASLTFFTVSRGVARTGRLRQEASADVAAPAAMIAAVAYAALAGFTVPTRRALVMAALVLTALRLRRVVAPLHVLSLALLLVLAFEPLAPLHPGFWLSFGAVAAICWSVAGRVPATGKLRGLLRAQAAVFVGLAPVSLGLFGQISLVGPAVNLVAVPLASVLIVPAVLAGSLLVLLWPAAGGAWLGAVAAALEGAWPWLERLAALPAAHWTPAPRPLWTAVLAAAGAALLLAPRGFPSRWLGALLVLPLLTWRPPAPAPGALWLTLLDVGQGLAAVVETHAHVLVYDTGPGWRSGGSAAQVTLLPFLRARGVRRLDRVVVSHGDDDHAGGLAALRAAYGEFDLLGGAGVHAGAACVAGARWHWDGVDFAVLHPPAGSGARGNDASCVLRIGAAGGSVLLSGDIERSGERTLLDAGAVLASDVVVAPHHGSRSSSTPRFVAATAPTLVLFAAGADNRWHFPHDEVLARWRRAGAAALATGEAGAVTLRLSAGGGPYEARAHRCASRRYWTLGC